MLTYDRIKMLCKQKGVTVTGTEKELGFARGSLCKVETNKPSMEKVQKLAEYFGVSVEFLTTGEEKTPTTIISSQATNYFIQMVYDVAEAEFGEIQAEEFSQKVRDNLPSDFGMPKKPITLAAHFDGDEYTEDELDEIRQFAEFVKNKRK
jgi:transcriptional regulator with XRE-family HTH domain